VGNDRFEPDRHGSLASLPSRWTLTNREGLEDPLPSSHAFAALAGAPQNDLIEEELGERLALNTHEYLYAGYLARIRRMVNFYWEQNLRNLPRTARVQDTSYLTEVRVVIDANGSIVDLAVTRTATLRELDDAVTRAYHLAAPFPPPPEGLIEADGKVHLPAMKWTARFSTSQVQFRGVDPRAGELYPGIHKTPR
jgi:TonB family protein